MEVEQGRGAMENVQIVVGSNSYEKVKTFKYLGSLLTKISALFTWKQHVGQDEKFVLLFNPSSFDLSTCL